MNIEINVLKRDGMSMNGGKFVYFKTVLIDENGDKKWVNLKFTKNCVFENNVKVLKTGVMTCEDSDVIIPLTLENRVDKNGKVVYPCVWVKRVLDFKEFETVKANQNMFGSFMNEQ